jgi:pyrroline-5-carboxylate reductase
MLFPETVKFVEVKMKQYQFGFLGCGNMGGALALAASKVLDAEELAICDASPEKTEFLTTNKRATCLSLEELAQSAKYLFLAVKPQSFTGVFDRIRPILQGRTDRFILVSIAAGITVEKIHALSGVDCPIIRVMPNTPVSVGEGMILYTANAETTEEEINGFLHGLSAAGILDAIPESLMDAGGALSGCGPAFVYLFAEALADGGVQCGLPREKAQAYAAQTLLGAARMMLETGKHPGELKDAVCSPGGTTIEGVHALEAGAFRATASGAVIAAFEKTAKLK